MTTSPVRPDSGVHGRRRRALTLLAGTALVVAGCAGEPSPATGTAVGAADEPTPSPPAGAASAAPSATGSVAAVPDPAPPVRVEVPAIGAASDLVDLGIAADGTLEVPADFDLAGWFTGGGRPGGRGPLVIAGHVDSQDGPAVFYRLRDLRPGDTVEVTSADGTLTRYEVTDVQDHPKDAFPTTAVFGATAGDELRLVTCGGTFDRTLRSYTDNLVVFAAAP